jgi:hypothetical protein
MLLAVSKGGGIQKLTRILALAVVVAMCSLGVVAIATAGSSNSHAVKKAPAKHARYMKVHHCPNMANSGANGSYSGLDM